MDPLSADRFHLQIEATQLAYTVRDAFVADPAFVDVPVDRLLSKSFADEVRAKIDMKKAGITPPRPKRYQ